MLIYRGVDEEMDLSLEGRLKPTGKKTSHEFTCDSIYVTIDNTDITINKSELNAVYAHQHQQIEMGQSGWLSCSRDYDVAKKFATLNDLVSGFIYVLDTRKFTAFNVEMIELESSPEKHEEEISIRPLKDLYIPNEVIVEKIRIDI